MDKSDDLRAFMYRTSVKAYRVPPVTNASQNRSPRGGIAVKSRMGNRNGSAKHGNDHATTYSSMSFRLFLLRTSFVASKSAVKNANMNQSMVIYYNSYLLNSPPFHPPYPIPVRFSVNLATSVSVMPPSRHRHLRIQTLSPCFEQSPMATQKIRSTYDLVPRRGR